jgi:hypothetical protein
MKKFNIGVFADNDFVYRVDGYNYHVESINDIDVDACVREAKQMFPTYSGILIREIEAAE